PLSHISPLLLHDALPICMQDIFTICDDVTVLRDGELIAERSLKEINEEQLIELMVGRKLSEQYPHIESPIGDTVLEVKNISGCGDRKSTRLNSSHVSISY